MKRIILILAILVFSVTWKACEKDTSDTGNNTGTDVEDGISHEAESDYSWDSSSEVLITLNGSSVSVNSASVTVTGTTATLIAEGNYRVKGSLDDGQLVVDAGTGLVRLILENAGITNSQGPAILMKNSSKTLLVLATGTSNTLSDGSSYTIGTDDPNAALFSKSDMTIFGEGTLTVNGNNEDGISSRDGLILKSGTLIVTAKDDGIRGKDYLIMEGGTLTVTSGGDGMKSDNEANTAVGYILMSGGKATIISGGDGMSAQQSVTSTGGEVVIQSGGGSSYAVSGDASAKGIKGLNKVNLAFAACSVNAADDAIHSNNEVIIESGTYQLSTSDDGIHADAALTVNNGDITVSKAYEGFESHSITVNAGNIRITSSDDSFNATAGSRTEQNDGSFEYIHGGQIVLNSTNGDPLDSNGSIEMTAGTVIIHGPTGQPEVAIDYNGTFAISGGFLIAAGPSSNMTQAPGTSSSQYSLKLMYKTSMATGTLFHLQDADGNDLATFQPLRNFQSVVFSSPSLQNGGNYSVYKSGSSSGTNTYGLYSGGTYSGGTLVKSFTISSKVTSLTNL